MGPYRLALAALGMVGNTVRGEAQNRRFCPYTKRFAQQSLTPVGQNAQVNVGVRMKPIPIEGLKLSLSG
jgi:hypothetical protein